MIQAKNICLSFGFQDIFDSISFTIQPHQRIGLVGPNGSGKSTLLKAINDDSTLDDGKINISKDMKIAYMPQNVILESNKTVFDETLSTFEKLYKLNKRALELEPIIENNNSKAEEYTNIQEILLEEEYHKKIARSKQILNGLGFSQERQNGPVSALSVGWKMRLVLAKLLLLDANFYLFDEPTNHLDIVAKDWFLKFLKKSNCGFLLVCHERYFLDELCEETFALGHQGKIKQYNGNYSFYEKQYEKEVEDLKKAYIQQQKEIKQKKDTIARFKAKASKAKMAKSMQKSLDKIELIQIPPNAKSMNFSFQDVERSGKVVLTAKNLCHSFGSTKIFENVSFEIERGDKIALVAPNGTGKSTLFNILTNQLKLQKGTIEFGYNVKHAFFAQDQNQTFNFNQSIIENLTYKTSKSESVIRNFLGSFLFSNDSVKKPIKVLSGGEKNRVAMIDVLLQDANFLLLDEPTNHLDIQSKDILLNALQSYNGTILFVSHDRSFVNNLANRIIELNKNGIKDYHGNYDLYIRQKNLQESNYNQNNIKNTNKTSKNKKQNKTSQKDQKKIEKEIEKLEKKIQLIQEKFADFEYGTQEFNDNQTKLENLENQLENLNKQWEQLL